MQTSVEFPAGRVTGTLKHIENWTQYSANPLYNTGNFLAFKVTSTTAGATFAAGLFPHIDTTRPDYVTDADGEFVFQITDPATQKLRVKTTVGGVESILEYELDELVCETE